MATTSTLPNLNNPTGNNGTGVTSPTTPGLAAGATSTLAPQTNNPFQPPSIGTIPVSTGGPSMTGLTATSAQPQPMNPAVGGAASMNGGQALTQSPGSVAPGTTANSGTFGTTPSNNFGGAAGASATGAPVMSAGGGTTVPTTTINPATGMPNPVAMGSSSSIPVSGASTSGTAGATPGLSGFGGYTSGADGTSGGGQTRELQDIYGGGLGADYSSLMTNLGSSDSSVIQSILGGDQAAAAKGLATLQTSMGNAGIGADSSTSALEQGDYGAQVQAQEQSQLAQVYENSQQQQIQMLENATGNTMTANSQQGSGIMGSIMGGLGDAAEVGSAALLA